MGIKDKRKLSNLFPACLLSHNAFKAVFDKYEDAINFLVADIGKETVSEEEEQASDQSYDPSNEEKTTR